MGIRRRDLLVSGVILLAVFGIPPVYRRFSRKFEFEPIPGLEGFRRLDLGPISGGPDVFAGLDPVDRTLDSDRAQFQAAPCNYLFGSSPSKDNRLPIAVFSDYNCPYCAVLSRRLILLERKGAPIRLVWYELPLLGRQSEWSARAALAAAQQSSYVEAHTYLMHRSLPPGRVGFERIADDLGLDANRLIRDSNGTAVINALRKAQALASELGVLGTPSTVVGRTLVTGSISVSDLDHLIKIERSEPDFICV